MPTLQQPGKFRRQRSRAAKSNASGSVLPYVIITALFAFVGLVLLASRSNDSNLSSIRQSDEATAREAAEYGISEITSQLNTKNHGYLWVTQWDKASRQWMSVSTTQLDNCNIAIEGAPDSSTISGAKSLPQSSDIKYQLIKYEPPKLPEYASLPPECAPFGNLFGGSAKLTVLGIVERPKGTVVAQFEATRRVHVIGPKVGGIGEFPLIVLGAGSSINKADSDFVQAESPDTNINKAKDLSIACVKSLAECFSGSQPSTTGVESASAFTFPPFPTPENIGGLVVPTSSMDLLQTKKDTPYKNFPYTNDATLPANPSKDDLKDILIDQSACKVIGDGEQIVCKVKDISISRSSGTSYRFGIDTTARGRKIVPVNLFISGTVTIKEGNYIGALPVTIQSDASLPPGIVYSDIHDPSKWNTLRMYGIDLGDSNANCSHQSIKIEASAAIMGAFSWFPNATVTYGVGGGGGMLANNFGILWVCRFIGPTSENQGYGARLDSPTGLGEIFGIQFTGISDNSSINGIPITTNFYRGYGVSGTE